MANRITNTPLRVNSYNARGLVVQHFVTRNCVRTSDGTLWAVIGDFSGRVDVVKSTDSGFSWNVVLKGIESGTNMREQDGFNADGLFAYLIVDERFRKLDIYMGEWESIGNDGSVERKRYDLDDLTVAVSNTTVLTTSDNPFQGMFDVCHNWEQHFVVWVDATGALFVTRASPRTTSVSFDDASDEASGCFGLLSSCCNEDGLVFIVYEKLNGSDRETRFQRYDSLTGSFTTPVVLNVAGASPNIDKDLCIARDGLGTLCAFWFTQNNTTGTATPAYSISLDNGDTWSTPESLTRTPGHGVFQDKVTGDYAARTNIIGGSKGGFVLSYVENNSSGIPRSYVRQLTTSDNGATYDLEEEREVATSAPWTNEPIVGVQFFHPPDSRLLDITDPGMIRIAFSVGEGDANNQADTKAVTFGQELLFESAYPTSLDSELEDYLLDTPDDNQLLVSFALLNGPEDYIDYYGGGFTGKFTDRYIAAFERIGTSIRLLQFEPDADNYLSDRSAYGAPVEYSSLALFDPVTYSFPSPALNRDTTIERIEQDVRKLHLPPTQFLSRTFLVNKGGFLKRTVWLAEHAGNQYEISQVIPRFINQQICYYECNAYVVGPSRDPFARVVLPSET